MKSGVKGFWKKQMRLSFSHLLSRFCRSFWSVVYFKFIESPAFNVHLDGHQYIKWQFDYLNGISSCEPFKD